MRGWVWRFYLGAGALATGGYYLLSYGAGAVLNVVVGASAVAAIAAGIRWHRPPRRAAWWLIAAAQGLFVAGDALFSVNELILGIEPFPSLADALYLPGYPVLATGLALLALSRGRDTAGVIDAAIIAIGFGLLSWVLVMVPYFQDPSLGLVELLVSLACPVGDVLLLALAARLATTPGRRPVAFRLLIASLAVMFAADMAFSVLALQGTASALVDGGYLVAYLLLGASALHPSLPALTGTVLAPWSGPGSGCSATRPRWPASSTPSRSAPSPATRGWTARCGWPWPAGSAASWRRSSTGSPRRRCST